VEKLTKYNSFEQLKLDTSSDNDDVQSSTNRQKEMEQLLHLLRKNWMAEKVKREATQSGNAHE
jgi:hypothetical protein